MPSVHDSPTAVQTAAAVSDGSHSRLPPRSLCDPEGYPLRIGACSAVISGCYFFSLRLAPPALASALHLTAPVILLTVALARG